MYAQMIRETMARQIPREFKRLVVEFIELRAAVLARESNDSWCEQETED